MLNCATNLAGFNQILKSRTHTLQHKLQLTPIAGLSRKSTIIFFSQAGFSGSATYEAHTRHFSPTMTGAESPPKLTLRRATPNDAGGISSLGTTIFAATFGHSCTPEQLNKYLHDAYSPEAVMRDIADPNKDTIVAVTEEGDELVGFVVLTRGTSEPCIEHVTNFIELQRIYVDSRYHGHGFGGRLEREAEDIARKQGFQHMWLGVWEENHKAIRVYEKLGFSLVGSHAFDLGGDVQNDLIMLKKL